MYRQGMGGSWTRLLVVCLSLLGCRVAASIEGCGKWENQTASGVAPKVYYHKSTSINGNVALFGGFGRIHHSFASNQLDSASDTIYLFGGLDSNGSDLNDLWIFTIDTNWTKVEYNMASWPPARSFHSMSISEGKVALFGGIEGGVSVLDDFWLYSVDQSLWMLLTPVVRPSARYNHFMAPIFSFLFLFAGRTAESTMDDVWAYKDHEWELMQDSPSSSLLADGISMAVINQATLFVNGGKLSNTFIEGVWTYNTCICPAGTEIGIHGCLPCNAGFIKNATGNQSCSPCPANTYSSVSRTTCETCPLHSVSGNRSQDKWNCTCIEGYGYEGGQELVCSECPRGYVKNSVGNYACSPCPANTYSSVSRTTCETCPLHSVSGNRSQDKWNCTCIEGYGYEGGQELVCSECPRGYVKNSVGNYACSPCPANTYSSVSRTTCETCPLHSVSGNRSQDKWNCTCIEGYGYEGGQELVCSECPRGYVKNSVGNYACSPCPANTYSSVSRTTCETCPLHSVSGNRSQDKWNCTCIEGYGYEGGQELVCSECPRGYVKNSVGNYACSPCPANTYTANSTKTCTHCTSNSSSPAGSWSVLNCTCNPGYVHELVNSTTCSACPEGKYRNVSATSCITCPPSTFSDVKGASSVEMCKSCPTLYYWKWFPIASAHVSLYPQFDLSESSFQLLLQQCGCNPGEGLNPSQLPYCVACEAGKYKDVFGPYNCTSCPNNMISQSGADSRLSCVCDKGYYGENGLNCSACPMGKYKSNSGSAPCNSCPVSKYSDSLAATNVQACLSCPDHSFSKEASTIISDCKCNALQTASTVCKCNAGYEPTNLQASALECVLCAAGRYKMVIDNVGCSACKPWFLPRNASYVSPTIHDKPCLWECLPGQFYLLSHLPNVYNEELKRSNYSNSLRPNTCLPCSPVPSTNPCGSGEFYNCTTYSRDG
ncbi:hypothetical protein GUITHDRAFT_139373 [Guillardia theta CCMP2712]|uniref:Tyrosine-protein kinase ephrin type A/B receptor-like domain-containing protein n=2 Tax=Guillardia theta TaxID=55529 RepID=L1JAI7_GUITC|nr:hypothetical protein GUITHDRAFT_139373 [Guillardia theta CCMP2712]EKX45110.1 hypothetical protein GUITHDRAFT_139373 [Guillardia theta CCMP2712]|eukprot:XP_005832090.1 hypothetical protein GUITHDRAFT_139373 [Guillardia theta CCMP2712]